MSQPADLQTDAAAEGAGQVVLIRDRTQTGYDLALATTDLAASPAAVIERYAARWPIDVAIEDAGQIFGIGRRATGWPQRCTTAVPFTHACQSLSMLSYATALSYATTTRRRGRAPRPRCLVPDQS